ncbi:hypothetical protein [Paludibacterium purpuratum]|uniref:Uncharacterized protein n=1 Tax=Paludibacterium purpuratum TaxID=1144873 RepID=A0A4V3DV99_9NEIS|nr:hypothetical protein [Paludibacterium purpuratum]TDR80109.1 hypothetical protein DFP86_106252 [Paludibacterium purpuratum]
MSNFIELCLQGDRLPEEIDDYVDAWHDGETAAPLHKFLGMTRSEYNLWIVEPSVLPFILDAHRTGKDAADLIEQFNALPMAARAESSKKALKLAHWLKEEGLWN